MNVTCLQLKFMEKFPHQNNQLYSIINSKFLTKPIIALNFITGKTNLY